MTSPIADFPPHVRKALVLRLNSLYGALGSRRCIERLQCG